MPYQKNPDELGALWEKNGKKGLYMSGSIEVNGEKIQIVAFHNTDKKKDNHPDWKILRAKKPENSGYSQPQSNQSQPPDDNVPF